MVFHNSLKKYLPVGVLTIIIILSGAVMLSLSINEPFPLYPEFNAWTHAGENTNIEYLRILYIAIASITATFIYIFTLPFLGKWWSLLPMLLITINPNTLGHGHYINETLYLNIAILAVIFLFVRQASEPNAVNLFFLTITYGAALFIDYSLITILLYFAVISLILILVKKYHQEELMTKIYQYIKLNLYLIAIAVISGFILYGLDFSSYIKNLFIGQPNFMENLLLYLSKETLPIILLALLASIFALKNIFVSIIKKSSTLDDYIATNGYEFSIQVFILFYFIYISIFKGPADVNNLIIILPFIYILISSGLKNIVKGITKTKKALILTAILIAPQITVTAYNYPDYISYFNSFSSSQNSWLQFESSNYDLGQNIAQLKKWIATNTSSNEIIAIDYDDRYNKLINSYFDGRFTEWKSSYGLPIETDVSIIIISSDELKKALKEKNLADGDPEKQYLWLNINEPDAQIEKSFFIYRI